jgi:hypothetical protein
MTSVEVRDDIDGDKAKKANEEAEESEKKYECQGVGNSALYLGLSGMPGYSVTS